MRRGGALAVALLLAAAACKHRGVPNPDVRMAVSHERADDAAAPPQTGSDAGAPGAAGGAGAGGPGGNVPTQLVIPPEVAQAWSGIRLGWKDKQSGKEGAVDVPLGEASPLPDPSLVVRADAFLPAFTMGGGAITSEGVEAQNPAARITVFEKGKEVFAGWIFTRFPDVHPFTHPRFQLRLEGGVPRAKK
ncbi:MAG TPA: hypothetical protein VGH97_02375 [Thermoanaerobaculia bacterium]|jgi:hypothetical protein